MVYLSGMDLGILSLVQMSKLHLFKRFYLGSGLLCVVGTSFATLSTATAVIDIRMPAMIFPLILTFPNSRYSTRSIIMGRAQVQQRRTGP